MSTYVFGDIHGNINAFQALFNLINPSSKDTLIFLGDYIDRGLYSKNLIDLILDLRSQYEVITLLGNHELMLLQSAQDDEYSIMTWLSCGGRETLVSYGIDSFAGWTKSIPNHHWDFYHSLLPYYETQTHIFVHAGIEPKLDLKAQSDQFLYWVAIDESNFKIKPHCSGKTVVVGHTITSTGQVHDYGHIIMVDTYQFKKNSYISALCLESGKVYQTNDFGQTHISQPLKMI